MTEENTQDAAQNGADAGGAAFMLQRIYLKDLSFESPMGVEAFKSNWQPKINQDLNTTTQKIEADLYEVVLKMTINVTIEDKTVFLVEIQQAGLFNVSNMAGPQLAQVLNTLCPQILYPYLREAVDNCALKGGFPALGLPPINFDVLYAQALKQKAAQEQAASGSSAVN